MRFASVETLWRSTGIRIAAIQAVLLTAAMLGTGIATWLTTRSSFESQMRERITEETAAIHDELTLEGMPGAITAVKARGHRPGSLIYRLEDSRGRRITGHLHFSMGRPGWHRLQVGGQELLALVTKENNGVSLIVAGDLKEGEALRNGILASLALWGGMALLFGLVLGLWLTRNALARIKTITKVIEQMPEGDLSRRIGLPSANDDLGCLAQRIDAMLDRIAMLVSVQRRLSAHLAHELRGPLTDLAFTLDELAEAYSSEARDAAHAEAVAALSRATALFDAMLRLAEIEAGTARARFAAIDLTVLASDIADAYRPEIEASGRTLELSLVPGCCVIGDADLVTQALANLLDNEMKFAPAEKAISLLLTRTADGIVLSIGDTGPDISAADFAVLVQPFARGHGSSDAGGVGLGLSIVSAIARLHGGELSNTDQHENWRVSWRWPPPAEGQRATVTISSQNLE